jgi:flagellar protein FlgJ
MAQAAAKGGALDPWRDGIPVNAQILSHSVHARPGAHPAASAYPEQAERTYGMHASLGKGIGAHRAVGHDERPFDSKEAFVQTLRPHAQRAGRELGVDPDLLLAQAALETNWGRQMRTDSNVGNSHNLFGMKAKSHWKGDTVRVLTTEYRGRHIQQEFHHFRAYGSYEESFRDYVSHLQANADRYGRALARAAHPRDFIQGLQRGGYATDPRYADKVMRVFQDELLSGAGKSVASR